MVRVGDVLNMVFRDRHIDAHRHSQDGKAEAEHNVPPRNRRDARANVHNASLFVRGRRPLRALRMEAAVISRTSSTSRLSRGAKTMAMLGSTRPDGTQGCTFDFLGFTHFCGNDRQGRSQVTRLTVRKRIRATREAIRGELIRGRHESVAIVGIPRSGSPRHTPEAGAVCGNSAGTDLCGGATSVASATGRGSRRHDLHSPM